VFPHGNLWGYKNMYNTFDWNASSNSSNSNVATVTVPVSLTCDNIQWYFEDSDTIGKMIKSEENVQEIDFVRIGSVDLFNDTEPEKKSNCEKRSRKI